MQKIATRIFIGASVLFGITGICLAIFGGANDNALQNQVFLRIIMTCIFVILPSFALSVAGKYLSK